MIVAIQEDFLDFPFNVLVFFGISCEMKNTTMFLVKVKFVSETV